MDHQPTGRSFKVEHVDVYRFKNGQIAEHWACRDDLDMFRQIGFFPGALS